ncbi:hypothetical protein [Mycolicibacterium brumae]|uniref:Uncharacterized protein n=1 Tax=Mycolicibacterium brumae TaxID=85968 RepID=A0A2G5PC75_9MYCO|nr:hypothetical protein [Mycolicibacterium brumae]MCV7193133.1 hypothetical protein [Mycolicibacterium brumae]PIB75946.1 hypothetical protein CQY22_007840 [Mycolicibacterium brumae]RWA16571.1 hypothetical protein MBRU_07545 [Mycolicibacterium brumae DSM 44177]UWW09788.1 hypothetical protein L2Z93_002900 [Mycolicibacterium brumae]
MTTLQSSFDKLRRAKVHRDALRADVEAFRAREPHDWVMRQSDHLFDPTLSIVRVVIQVKEEMPDYWGLIFGDILTNLRAALDHAVYSHAVARVALTPRQERQLHYPIITDPTKWPSAQTALSSLIDPAVLTVIDQCQPFRHSAQDGGPDWHPLTILNRLVNLDKHRAVRLVLYTNESFSVTSSELPIESVDTAPVEMTNGAVAATIVLRLPPKTPRPAGRLDDAWTEAPLDIVNAYVENIEVPVVNDTRPLLFAADELVRAVDLALNTLKAAGC